MIYNLYVEFLNHKKRKPFEKLFNYDNVNKLMNLLYLVL